MEDLFRDYWWLIFPIMGFGLGAYGMFIGYRIHRDRMDLLRMYAEKGRDPPADLTKALEGDPDGDPAYGWRKRGGRRGPYWEWRRAVIFVCLAIGFGLANYWNGDGDGTHIGMPFGLLTIIFGVLAVGSVLFAVLATVWKEK